MLFDYSNKALLNDIYVHDADFTGFTYDYKNREIKLQCRNDFLEKMQSFVFHNVIVSKMQSCAFWGNGYNFYDMSTVDPAPELDALYKRLHENETIYKNTYLNGDTHYIGVEFIVNSGDELLIVCESVEYTEETL